MYRGWYKGQREWGSARSRGSSASPSGTRSSSATELSGSASRRRANLRWEAAQFRAGKFWHRWDYPYPVGSTVFDDRADGLRHATSPTTGAPSAPGAYRPFRRGNMATFWKPRDGVDRRRKDLKVDWDNLQKPGFSADYLRRGTSAWTTTASGTIGSRPRPAQALLRNNRPLLAYIAGKPEPFTSKDHNFRPGEMSRSNSSSSTIRGKPWRAIANGPSHCRRPRPGTRRFPCRRVNRNASRCASSCRPAAGRCL